MEPYNPKNIEGKWQKKWTEDRLYETDISTSKEKMYVLDMFPYPSGEGLHVGHPKGYIATDIYSRMKKMSGYEVLHPMGWDAFGLPAEQFALKNKVHPRIAVEKNVARFKEQLSIMGFNYDWSKEINTTDPQFYKWTQWIFKQMWKKGLAYESNEPINWCPSCKTGLANEDLDGDVCERCGTKVEKKPLRQWVLKITEYADRMVADLDKLDWPEGVKLAQKNWIGKSDGSEIEFSLRMPGHDAGEHTVKVFTTRADTLMGSTFLAISAELAEKWGAEGWVMPERVKGFVARTLEEEKKREFDFKDTIEKEGIQTDVTAIHPITKEELPVWVANYVLPGYGTGALMAVPAHDERDFEFAKKYEIKMVPVISPDNVGVVGDLNQEKQKYLNCEKPYVGEGGLINSGKYDGMSSAEARKKITQDAGGKFVSQYKLKDWVFARQRYWGEPFPIVFDENHTAYAVADSELPVLLPEVESYEPTGTGESPLAAIGEWVRVTGYVDENNDFVHCDASDPRARNFTRETNTMPQWAGSSWYYLRFADPHNAHELTDKGTEKKWQPVDVYVGGDHATRHLIYARFWHKFLFDIGVVSSDEPFSRLEFLGFILAEDGRKMSKRLGNVINPDDVIREYGADTLRVYEMFMAPFEQTVAWDTKSIVGVERFLERVWKLQTKVADGTKDNPESLSILHKTVKKVGDDIESFKFNTAISAMMICLNAAEKEAAISKEWYLNFIRILAPFAPHISEELWNRAGEKASVHEAAWPTYDEALLQDGSVTIAIQIGGKLRATAVFPRDALEDEVLETVKQLEIYQKYVGESVPKKIIFVQNKLINIVI